MNRIKPSIWIYPCLFSAASVGAVLFSPLLPIIQKQFALSSDSVQLLLSLYLFGFAISQILYTLPAKRFGKKKMIMTALSVGLVGNLTVTAGAYASLFPVLLVGRILCALGAGGTLGLAMGLILDFYRPSESVQVISLGVTSFGVFPGIATVFAGFLAPYSWIWPLHLLSLYFIFLLFFVQNLPELEEKKERVSFSKFMLSVFEHLRKGSFLVYTCIWGMTTASLYLYVTYASLMAVNLWGMGIRSFSMVFSCVPFGMIGGMLFNRLFFHRLGMVKTLRVGMVMEITFICLVIYSLQLKGFGRAALFFAAMFGVYLCVPIVSSNATSLALEHSPDRSVGSALIGCLNLLVTTSVLFIVRAFPTDGEVIFDKTFTVHALVLALLLVLQVRISSLEKVR